MEVNRDAALMIARARAPRGVVGMTDIMMVSQALIEAVDEIERLKVALTIESERSWWQGFENAANIAKGEKIEETLRSKIEHFRSRRR